MSFVVLNSPLFTTIQDKGRYGFNNIGVTNSGVMDEFAYLCLNQLLLNKKESNVLEISFSNLELKVLLDTQLAITGAFCEFFINGVKKNIWCTHNIKVNDIIKVGKILSGSKVYLGVKDGFIIDKEFGSNSTTIKENLGGLNGSKIKKGDILPFAENSFVHNCKLKKNFIPIYEEKIELRVLLSYQEKFFSKEEKEKFFSNTYTVSNDFNRMACKLNGLVIKCDIDGIISEGISFGSIQIPSDGQPIILLKDRQTIGGYPKIGSVLSIDCFKLAQCKPNTKVVFKEVNEKMARNKLKEFYSSFN